MLCFSGFELYYRWVPLIRFLEGSRTNRKTNSEHSFDILTARNEDMIFSKRKNIPGISSVSI